eukprot:403344037
MNLLGSSFILRNLLHSTTSKKTLGGQFMRMACAQQKQSIGLSQLQTYGQRSMSYLSANTQRFKQLDAEQIASTNDTQFSLRVPFEAQTLQVKADLSQTIKDLSDMLQSQCPSVQEIKFYTLDGAIIPKSEILGHRNNIPFILTLKKSGSTEEYSYALNLNPGFSIVNDYEDSNKKGEEAYLQYNLGIGLPKYSSFLLANFANKIHHSIPQSQTVKTEDIIKGLNQTMNYYRSVGDDKSILRVSELEKLLDDKQHELYKLNEQKNQLYKKADFKSQVMLFMGSAYFFAQAAFIMGGTFVYYSWDIMEPISYMMLFTNFTFGVTYYAMFKKELALSTLRESFANRFANRMYRKKGLDIQRAHQLEKEIIELRKVINQSMN